MSTHRYWWPHLPWTELSAENKPPFANEWVKTTPVAGSDTVQLPTRLYDIETDKVVESKTLDSVKEYDILSYSWGQWDQPGSNGFSAKFKQQLAHMKTRGVQRYLWIDYACIIQTDDEVGHQDKERELPKMHHYYTRAAQTHVLLPDVACTVSTRGTMPYEDAGHKACELKEQVEKSKWLSRLWTFQEGACAGEVRLWMKNQDIGGDEFTMWMHLATEYLSCSEEKNLPQRMTHRKRKKDYSLVLPMDYTDDKLRFSQNGKIKGLFSDSQRDLNPGMIGERARKYYGKEVRLGREQRRPGMYGCITEAWVAAGDRRSGKAEDLVYGVLAMLENGHKVVPAVGKGFGEAMCRVADAGLVSTTILCSRASEEDMMSWLPLLQYNAERKEWQLASTYLFNVHLFGLQQRGMRDTIRMNKDGAVLRAKRLHATMTKSWGKKLLILNSSWRSTTVKLVGIMSLESDIKIPKSDALLIKDKATEKCLVLIGSETGSFKFRRTHTIVVEDVDKWTPDEEWTIV